jgi:hypothetical protein
MGALLPTELAWVSTISNRAVEEAFIRIRKAPTPLPARFAGREGACTVP